MAKQNQSAAVEPSNLVKDGAVLATTIIPAGPFGDVDLSRGSMNVSDRFGRSVVAVTAKVPFNGSGIAGVFQVYGRLDDKTGKIRYEPSISAKTFDGTSDSKDALKAHIVSAIKGWPEWSKVKAMADHAVRTGKPKATRKNADGTETELETSLESDAPEPAKTEKPATEL